jgi:hypothetical protein
VNAGTKRSDKEFEGSVSIHSQSSGSATDAISTEINISTDPAEEGPDGSSVSGSKLLNKTRLLSEKHGNTFGVFSLSDCTGLFSSQHFLPASVTKGISTEDTPPTRSTHISVKMVQCFGRCDLYMQ